MAAWHAPRIRRFMDAFVHAGRYGSDVGWGRVADERREAQRWLAGLFCTWIDAGLMRGDVPLEFLA